MIGGGFVFELMTRADVLGGSFFSFTIYPIASFLGVFSTRRQEIERDRDKRRR